MVHFTMFDPHTVCHCEMKAFLQGHQWMAGPKTDRSRACGAVGTRDLRTVGCGGGNRAKLPRAADLLEAPAGLLCAGTRDS